MDDTQQIFRGKVIKWRNREVWYATKVGLVYDVVETPLGYRSTEFGTDDEPLYFFPEDMEILEVTHIDLNVLADSRNNNSISGRDLGKRFAQDINLVKLAKNGGNFVIHIDDSKVHAINDTFIKGMFENVCYELKHTRMVADRFKIEGNDHYKRLFYKNWLIIDAMNNR
jgi:hypothetical protein